MVPSRPIMFGAVPDQARRRPGRPRKWASDAERKRAYRARRATELAEPHRLRDEAREARAAFANARTEFQTARRAVQRAEQRALTAERRSAKLFDQLRASQAELTGHRPRIGRHDLRRRCAPDGPVRLLQSVAGEDADDGRPFLQLCLRGHLEQPAIGVALLVLALTGRLRDVRTAPRLLIFAAIAFGIYVVVLAASSALMAPVPAARSPSGPTRLAIRTGMP